MKKIFSIMLVIIFMLSVLGGCSRNGAGENISDGTGGTESSGDGGSSDCADSSGNSTTNTSTGETDFAQTDAEMFTDRDYEVGYDESTAVFIQLSGDTATASSDSVKISGSTVTITEEATYIISGTLEDGMLIVDAPDTAKLQLVLGGVNINSETSAALYILEADKVFVTLAENTENTLSNGGTFTAIDENNIDGAIFSKQDLTLNGLGSLTVTSPAGHGIVCKDDLVFTSGTYDITSASHGLDANDSVRIANAAITIDAGKDGIHGENSDDTNLGFVYVSSGTLDIEAEGDGMSAGAYMQIVDGSFAIVAGGGSENGSNSSSDFYGGFRGQGRPEVSSPDTTDDSSTSMKGLKADGSMLISGGNFTVDSADDGIHSNASITIENGTLQIATGDDGIHADEKLTITAGTIQISESYEGLEALNIAVSGGVIDLVASDDGINAAGGTDASGTGGGRDGMFGGGGMSSGNGSILISGGTISISASGDGFDANGTLSITDGMITVSGANSGDTSILDFDSEGTISGGTFIGTGASGMTQNFSSSSTQGVIMVITDSQSEGTAIELTDSNGTVLVSAVAEREFSCVILSHPSIIQGETYTLTVGSSGTTITMDSTVYGSGGMGGGMVAPGGMGGRR